MDKLKILLYVLAAVILSISIFLIVRELTSNSMFRKLQKLMTEDITAPPLKKDGVVRVYVSGGMFNLSDTIYSVGPDGLKPGLNYQAIDFTDVICSLTDDQWSELKNLCVEWDVPWYGICGEIKKIGWECYCPIRDGITMSVIQQEIFTITKDQCLSDDSSSMFYIDSIKKAIANNNPSDQDIINYSLDIMNTALGINIGANDLYCMYGSCNACILNYNGIQADAGALAEIGQLGARGVPSVILRGQVTGDFGGILNPMPVMATTANNTTLPNLTNNNGSIFINNSGALPYLQAKVNRFINADYNKDPMTFGSYNNEIPLPPLQIFWASLGSSCYFLKHRSKSIPTDDNGKSLFKQDYTDFWYNNFVIGGNQGAINIAKKMTDNLNSFLNQPKFKNIMKYWS